MNKNGSILILVTGCMWATTGIWSHLFQGYDLTSMMMALFRVGAAVFLLTICMLLKGMSSFKLSRRGYVIAFAQGLLTQTIFNAVYFKALSELGMASAVVLLYTSPMTVAILSYFIFKEAITGRKILAMIITLAGCALTATGGNFDLESISLIGIGLGLISGFCYGTLSITGRLAGETEDPMAMTYYTMLFGFIGLIAISLFTDVGSVHVDGKLILVILGAGAISVAIPYFMFGKGVSMLREASMAPILSSTEIIAAAIYGTVLFKEPLGIYRVMGIVLVMVSIVMTNIAPAKK